MNNRSERREKNILEKTALVFPILMGLIPETRRLVLEQERMVNLRLKALNLYPTKKIRALSLMATAQKIETKLNDIARSKRITAWLNLSPADFKVKNEKIERDPPISRGQNYSQLDIDFILKNARAELEIARMYENASLVSECEDLIKRMESARIG